jgi:hypothetical protein
MQVRAYIRNESILFIIQLLCAIAAASPVTPSQQAKEVAFSRNRSFNVRSTTVNNSARVETIRKWAREHINESTNTAIQIQIAK